MVHWTDGGSLFDAATPGWQARCDGSTYGCYRPHVVYDAATGRYVLWINSYDVSVGYHVFTSGSPTGPFVEQPVPHLGVNDDAPVGVNNGDEDAFVDKDGRSVRRTPAPGTPGCSATTPTRAQRTAVSPKWSSAVARS
jgi:hypothetical protein